MGNNYKERVELARELIQTVPFAAMATVNEDGSPHNTPYFFMYDKTLTHLYWGSHPESLHSRNVERTRQVFVVLYNSIEYGKGGVYITANKAHRLEGSELSEGLRVHNAMRKRMGKAPIPREYYDKGPQAMYGAEVVKLEVHTTERDEGGYIIKEVRKAVSSEDLVE